MCVLCEGFMHLERHAQIKTSSTYSIVKREEAKMIFQIKYIDRECICMQYKAD